MLIPSGLSAQIRHAILVRYIWFLRRGRVRAIRNSSRHPAVRAIVHPVRFLGYHVRQASFCRSKAVSDKQPRGDRSRPAPLLQCPCWLRIREQGFQACLRGLWNANHDHRSYGSCLLGAFQRVKYKLSSISKVGCVGAHARYVNEDDMTLPVTGSTWTPAAGRSWLIRWWQLDAKYVGIAVPFGLVLFILFYFDANVSVGPRRIRLVVRADGRRSLLKDQSSH